MLEIINAIAHGFVVLPMLASAEKAGFFEVIKKYPDQFASVEELAAQLKVNSGPLSVALNVFCTLEWCQRNADKTLRLNVLPQSFLSIALQAMPLLEFGTEDFFSESAQGQVTAYLKALSVVSFESESIELFAYSPVLMLSLLKLSELDLKVFFEACQLECAQLLQTYFRKKNWLDQSGQFTETGRYLIEHAFSIGTVFSYRALFSNMDALLTGDFPKAFQSADGKEAHVDRVLNVQASGFQHQRYFKLFVNSILEKFNTPALANQPHYIVDMGCGDASFLKIIYEAVCTQSTRGQHLKTFPLTLVGVDYNQDALNESAKNLLGIPHQLIQGDINDPEKLIVDLRAHGIDPEQALHVRSFLDHNRPYFHPEETRDSQRIREVFAQDFDCSYLNDSGGLVSPAEMMNNLVAFLGRWSRAINQHGLFLLEVHSLPIQVVKKRVDELENLHFDAYHALSKQFLVKPEVFLLAAAMNGLFSKPSAMKAYPELLTAKRIVCHNFGSSPYRLRLVTPADLPALIALEKMQWEEALWTPAAEIQSRLQRYPEGQFLIENDQEILGVVYTQPLADFIALKTATFSTLAAYCDLNGAGLQLLGMFVHPDYQALGIGEQLIQFVKQWAMLKGQFKNIVGLSRCGADFRKYAKSYVDYALQAKPIDPVLEFHHALGAQIECLVSEYRPQDRLNLGHGVMLRYSLGSPSLLASSTEQQTQSILEQLVSSTEALLNRPLEKVEWSVSLRDLGVDSLGLMQLRSIASDLSGQDIPVTFFFQYNTLQQAAEYLEQGLQLALDHMPEIPVMQPSLTKDAILAEPIDPRHIAIVGMSCDFPEAENIQAFWQFLEEGRCAITERTEERAHSVGALKGAKAKYLGGFITGVQAFDHQYFNISEFEAERMDPQQRRLLELAVEALDDAGIPQNQLRNTDTGVFVGAFSEDYAKLLDRYGATDLFNISGCCSSIIANRISYCLGLEGPSMTVNAACSSSLVALHLALQSLISGETKIALVAGVNLLLDFSVTDAFAAGGMIAADGLCKTFSQQADGYVRSEGMGLVVLKPLEQAIKDRDRIYAVVVASAVNQDGASNGLTAPNLNAQIKVLQQAYSKANCPLEQVQYIEAHGTGTILGDPIEVQALNALFKTSERDHPCMLGSVKSNLGHLESAAGIAGLIKVALSLHHQKVPATLHAEPINSYLQFDPHLLKIQTTATAYHSENTSIYAGVSAFSFGGTNAHVVLKNYPLPAVTVNSLQEAKQLFCFSAKNIASLQAYLGRMEAWLPAETALASLSYTLAQRRTHYPVRWACTASSVAELKAKLNRAAPVATSEIQDFCFVCSGQGNQWLGMGPALLADDTLKSIALEIDHTFSRDVGWSLVERLKSLSEDMLSDTQIIQPLLFGMQVVLMVFWKSMGIEAKTVIGHSTGDVTAAYYAGCLSLSDACRLIKARAECLAHSSATQGRMLLVNASAEDAAQLIQGYDQVWISVFNDAKWTAISGLEKTIEALKLKCQADKIFHQVLPAKYAFHCELCGDHLSEFIQVAKTIVYQKPSIAWYSSVTGAQVHEIDSQFWVRNIVEPVQFQQAMSGFLTAQHNACFIEIAPHNVLTTFVRNLCHQHGVKSPLILSSMRAQVAWQDIFKDALAGLYAAGYELAFESLNLWSTGAAPLSLPAYAWQRRAFWPIIQESQSITMAKEVSAEVTSATEVHPVSSFETLLKNYWAELLNITDVSSEKTFLELGANSLLAAQVVAKLKEALEVEISFRDMFDYPTTKALAHCLYERQMDQNLH